VAALVALSIGTMGVAQSAAAAVVGTRTVMMQTKRAAAVERVQTGLARADVRDQLIALGVEPEAAKSRIASLSDRELSYLDGRLSDLPAGAGVVEVIGIVFVVLLVLELVGVIDIFKSI
jgi:hypothetical protein